MKLDLGTFVYVYGEFWYRSFYLKNFWCFLSPIEKLSTSARFSFISILNLNMTETEKFISSIEKSCLFLFCLNLQRNLLHKFYTSAYFERQNPECNKYYHIHYRSKYIHHFSFTKKCSIYIHLYLQWYLSNCCTVLL